MPEQIFPLQIEVNYEIICEIDDSVMIWLEAINVANGMVLHQTTRVVEVHEIE